MTNSHWDALQNRDWSDEWDSLPEAPAIVSAPKTSQITLRLPATQLARIKRVASTRSIPYHVLVRSWIADGVRGMVGPGTTQDDEEQLSAQLNIKLDQDLLHRLKSASHEAGRPYHRLAREWTEYALQREEEVLSLPPLRVQNQPVPVKDLMVMLLHTRNTGGRDAVHGITRLQKLLFVIEQKLAKGNRFYAYNYGPFSEDVNDAAEALKLAGFLQASTPPAAGPPSFADMISTVVGRSGPRGDHEVEDFELNDIGHEIAERLTKSNDAYRELYEQVQALRREWDTPDLVERVYETFPQFATRSLIRDEVTRRRNQQRQV